LATPPKGTDRRVQRTRQIIRQAFIEVVREKGLEGANIREITERANVSRTTFYAHYPDKFALIETFVREEFQKLVGTLPLVPSLNRQTLPVLIQAVLEYVQRIYQRHHLSRDLAPLIERTIHEELNTFILAQLKQSSPNRKPLTPADTDTQAQLLSWAIFGAAIEWSGATPKIPAAQKAQAVVIALSQLDSLTADSPSKRAK
jgi:AcrR family transcriptional regulator